MSKRMVEETIFHAEEFDSDFPLHYNKMPHKAEALAAWLLEQVSKAPETYRGDVTIEIDSEDGYEGEHHLCIKLSYLRPETEPEASQRAAEEASRAQEAKAADLRLLAALKAQYGDVFVDGLEKIERK